jgi:hypothetical protein
MSQGDKDGRKLDEGVGVVRQADPVVPQDVAQNGKRNPAGLVAGDIPLQAIDTPEIVECEPREAKVGLVSAMTSHLVFLLLSFIVSKERVAKDYSSVKQRIYPEYFPTTFILFNL